MHRYQIQLVTMKDIVDFVDTVSKIDCKVTLHDGNEFCVNAKSMLGATATVEWNTLFCDSEEPIYSKIERFCIT